MIDPDDYARDLTGRMRGDLLGDNRDRKLVLLIEELALYPPIVAAALALDVYCDLPCPGPARHALRNALGEALVDHLEAELHPGHCPTCSGTGEGGTEHERCHACNGKGSR